MFAALCAVPASAANLYVATTGSDANPGTSTAPFKTILKASQVAKPGDVVNVASGTYTGGFKTLSSGTASARITYKSTVKWGAKIIPSSNGTSVWEHLGNYSNIVDFDINGNGSSIVRLGLYVGGSFNLVQGNHVHHLAQTTSCTNTGGSAIGSDSYSGGVKNDVIGNVVNHIGSPACISHIHGIYISTSGAVKNNLVHDVGGAAIHLWHDASNVDIVNNTTTSSGYGIIVGGGNFYHSTTGKADYVNVYNNIVFDNGTGIDEQGVTGANNYYLNNLVYQNSTNWSLDPGKSHAGTVTANPQFVSYARNSTLADFHLKSTSPAINKGLVNLAPATDIEGTARPQNSYFDIGAYEYRSTAAAVMSVSPASLAFASQPVGAPSAAKIITIKNTGTANMTFPAAFTFTGNFGFGNVGSSPCQIGTSYAPGASCTASVAFTPTATGTRTGSLKITSNVSTVTVSLSGAGI